MMPTSASGDIRRRSSWLSRQTRRDREFDARGRAAVRPAPRSLRRESETLAQLRDALLPKLISGEIRVPDTADPDEVIEPVADDARRSGVMTPYVATEDTLAEQPALARLCDAAWLDARTRELSSRRTLLPPSASCGLTWCCVERLRRAVARINPQLSPEAVQRACDLALTTTSPSVIEDHRSFHELLLSGVPVAYQDADGAGAVRARAARGLRRAVEQRVPRGQPAHDHRRREEPPAGHPAVRQRAAAGSDRAEGTRRARTWRRRSSTRSATTPTRSRRCTATSRSSARPTT